MGRTQTAVEQIQHERALVNAENQLLTSQLMAEISRLETRLKKAKLHSNLLCQKGNPQFARFIIKTLEPALEKMERRI